jgi:hypothetical protein
MPHPSGLAAVSWPDRRVSPGVRGPRPPPIGACVPQAPNDCGRPAGHVGHHPRRPGHVCHKPRMASPPRRMVAATCHSGNVASITRRAGWLGDLAKTPLPVTLPQSCCSRPRPDETVRAKMMRTASTGRRRPVPAARTNHGHPGSLGPPPPHNCETPEQGETRVSSRLRRAGLGSSSLRWPADGRDRRWRSWRVPLMMTAAGTTDRSAKRISMIPNGPWFYGASQAGGRPEAGWQSGR